MLKDSKTCLFELTNQIEDILKGSASSNETPAVMKSMNIDIVVVGTSSQLFVRGS